MDGKALENQESNSWTSKLKSVLGWPVSSQQASNYPALQNNPEVIQGQKPRLRLEAPKSHFKSDAERPHLSQPKVLNEKPESSLKKFSSKLGMVTLGGLISLGLFNVWFFYRKIRISSKKDAGLTSPLKRIANLNGKTFDIFPGLAGFEDWDLASRRADSAGLALHPD